jgi:hypothetical protein
MGNSSEYSQTGRRVNVGVLAFGTGSCVNVFNVLEHDVSSMPPLAVVGGAEERLFSFLKGSGSLLRTVAVFGTEQNIDRVKNLFTDTVL